MGTGRKGRGENARRGKARGRGSLFRPMLHDQHTLFQIGKSGLLDSSFPEILLEARMIVPLVVMGLVTMGLVVRHAPHVVILIQ